MSSTIATWEGYRSEIGGYGNPTTIKCMVVFSSTPDTAYLEDSIMQSN
jgi:hypothetical protein